MTDNLQRVVRQIELQRNTALSQAALKAAEAEALLERLEQAGAEIANLRSTLDETKAALTVAERNLTYLANYGVRCSPSPSAQP